MTDPTAIQLAPVAPGSDPYVQELTGYAGHSGNYIHYPFITKIAPNLYHGGVETGLILPRDIDYVLSLYKWEQYIIKHPVKETLTVTMLDSTEQDLSEIDELAEWVNIRRKLGNVLVHCQAGLNRSSLVIARALYLNGEVGTPNQIVEKMRAERSPEVLCNPAFEAWVLNMGREDS